MKDLETKRKLLPPHCPSFYATWVPKLLASDPDMRPELADMVEELTYTSDISKFQIPEEKGETTLNFVYDLYEDFPAVIVQIENSTDPIRKRQFRTLKRLREFKFPKQLMNS
jgi:hypothetical protein